MPIAQITVTFFGIGLSIFIIWFFFFSKKQRTAATATREGVQEVLITVKGGYTPDVVVVKRNKPVRINFVRQETDDCSERVIFGDFDKTAILTPFKTVPVEFTPNKSGEFEFTCGMGMLRGKLIVE